MGLDNGITLKIKDKNINLPKWLKATEQNHYSSKGEITEYKLYEIMYWRKCWDLRNALVRTLECKTNHRVRITLNNLHYLKKTILYYYFTWRGIKSWNTRDMNYYGYSFYLFRQGLIYLYRIHWIRNFLEKYGHSVYIYFYDSF